MNNMEFNPPGSVELNDLLNDEILFNRIDRLVYNWKHLKMLFDTSFGVPTLTSLDYLDLIDFKLYEIMEKNKIEDEGVG